MNVLIVDDESVILEGISRLTKDSGFCFDGIYTAVSTARALEILRSVRIDILISDIKMPMMDGFELIEKASKTYKPEIIMITGFAEFEYVQKALNAGALGYILKPIDEKEFRTALKKAVDRVIEKRTQKTERSEEDAEKERILNRLFVGSTVPREQLERIGHDMMPAGDCGGFLLISFHIKPADGDETDIRLAAYELENLANEYFQNNLRGLKLFFFSTDDVHILQCLCAGNIPESLEKICGDFLQSLKLPVPMKIYISMSDVRRNLSRELYVHSQEAYYERFLDTKKTVLKHRSNSLQMVSGIEKELKLIDVAISNEDMTGLRILLEKMFSAEYIIKSAMTVKAIYFLVANTVILTFSRLNTEINSAQVDEFLSEKFLHTISEVSELAESVYSFVFEILMNQKSSKGVQLTIAKIINYIDTNFDKELSVKELSNMFGLTPNYLSQMFKKEAGENFAVYLNKLRINKACEYLRESDIKIHEISNIVGYRDSQYFYRVFKKYTGFTPIEFRMNEKQ